MGMKSRRKGATFEREIVHALQDLGLAAERIPLSGAAGGSFCDDIQLNVPVLNADKHAECKRRARGFSTIYGMLGGAYCLFIRDDNRKPLVVMPLEAWADLAKGRKE